MERTLDALKAAAEPTRLRLLALCASGELTVSEITEVVGVSQPRVSRHLKILCTAGLLDRFREQAWVFYRVPVAGRGAEMARGLLRLVPPDDPVLSLDRERLEQVLARRLELAEISATGEALPAPAGVDARVLALIGEEPLGDLLDIGTGTGRMLRLLGARTDTALGIDISREMLMLARSNLHAAGLDHLTVRQGNMYQLRFGDQSFDTVTIDQVLFQAELPGEVIREAARVLRPRGRLLLVEFLTASAGNGAPAGEDSPVSRQALAAWFADAGLETETWDELEATPWPLAISVARRPAQGQVAAA
ncbi:MAG: metalloregulator ArsR/SmtB family transcription factor [Gammaproteobacteria bacterium]